jgi:murein DD-endopeptidase MepM/ murein hydrolase activator NlpD
MSPENVRRRRGNKRYSFILFPTDDSAHSRTFSLTTWAVAAVIAGSLAVFVGLVVVVIVYTPLGRFLPIAHPDLEQSYATRLNHIQDQLHGLTTELTELRSYNIKLRAALGENVTASDSTYLAQHTSDPGYGSSRQNSEPPVSTGAADQFRNGTDAGGQFAAVTAAQFFNAGQKPAAAIVHDLPFASPAQGFFTREFDPQNYHYGVDIAGKEGNPIYAAASGRVTFANWTYDDGFEIILSHDKGYTTVYKHNQALVKSVGDIVRRGEVIALLGNTGHSSSGPHLHFEVWKDGAALNPMNYLLTVQ